STGWCIFLTGLVLFLLCALQVYYYKFTRRGVVTKGLYKYIRHPQYTSLIIMGFGTLLIWPRILVLISYIIMILLYYFLSVKEENECIAKYKEGYVVYINSTSMFLPGDRRIKSFLPEIKSNIVRIITSSFSIIIIIVLIIFGVVKLQDFSIQTISAKYINTKAYVSTARITDDKLNKIITIIENNMQAEQEILKSGADSSSVLIYYIVPNDWILPDLPLDPPEISMNGHNQPEQFDESKYKILVVKVETYDGKSKKGADIIKSVKKRIPIVILHIDLTKEELTGITKPPKTVLWGDIPTPII
ncbi:MAG: hypothetical protein C0412_22240, partial [Flavobacterium sp.]|nr:hypothetical protein [Flavobacterium sp.]